MEAFPDDSVEIRKRLAEYKTESEAVSVDNKMDTATLYDKEGNLVLPVVSRVATGLLQIFPWSSLIPIFYLHLQLN